MAVEVLPIPTFEYWWQFIGKFHPLVIHFPIVFLIVLFVTDLFYFFTHKTEFLFKLRSVILYISVLTAIVAVATGLMASGFYPENDLLVEHHKSLAILALIVISANAIAWFYSPFRWRIKYFVGFFTLSLATMVLISLTGEAGAIIVRDTTPFQTKVDLSRKYRILNDSYEVLKFPSEKLRSYLRENITYTDVHEVFVRNRCANCHTEQFSGKDFSGLMEGQHPWLTLDEKGNLKDFEKSLLYTKVILKNTMPPKGEVRDVAGLNAADRLVLLEWLVNNLKFQPPENSEIEE